MEIIIGAGIFVSLILVIEGIYLTYTTGLKSEQKKARKRLRTLSVITSKNEDIDILRKRLLSDITWFNELLFKISHLRIVDRLLEQANAKHSLGRYIFLTILFASCGYIAGFLFIKNFLLRVCIAVFLGSLPFLKVYSARKQRMLKFERQLPDALDLIVRALKAGHAFSGGVKMVADEFEDPIGTEFEKVLDEINFGVGVPDALVNLINRVACPDLKFFVVSVIIQRETGGNLAEILSKISYLIRERFKLNGRVKVLSAEGKLSAYILVALPFLMAFYLLLVNPDYLKLLFTDPIGRTMVLSAVIMMVAGIFFMKRIVAIKV